MKMLTACVGTWLAITAWAPACLAAQPGFLHVFYVSNQRVVTLEIIDEGEAILNFINLGKNFELLQSTDLLILDANGGSYRGHLFKRDRADREQSHNHAESSEHSRCRNLNQSRGLLDMYCLVRQQVSEHEYRARHWDVTGRP